MDNTKYWEHRDTPHTFGLYLLHGSFVAFHSGIGGWSLRCCSTIRAACWSMGSFGSVGGSFGFVHDTDTSLLHFLAILAVSIRCGLFSCTYLISLESGWAVWAVIIICFASISSSSLPFCRLMLSKSWLEIPDIAPLASRYAALAFFHRSHSRHSSNIDLQYEQLW